MRAQTLTVLAGDDAQIRRRRLGKRISNLSFSLCVSLFLGAFSLSRSSLSSLSVVCGYSYYCEFYVITRGNTALFYISLLCVVVVGVEKERKISSERVFCEFEKNLPFSTPTSPPPRTTKNLFREMRALLLCVVIHTSSSFIQREKKHLHHYQRESTYNKQKQILTTKRPHHQTKSLGRYTKEQQIILRKRKPERDASNARAHSSFKRKILPFFHEKK